VSELENDVAGTHGAQSVGDQDDRVASTQVAPWSPSTPARSNHQRIGSLIQYEDRRPPRIVARAIPIRWRWPPLRQRSPFAYHVIVSTWQSVNEFVRVARALRRRAAAPVHRCGRDSSATFWAITRIQQRDALRYVCNACCQTVRFSWFSGVPSTSIWPSPGTSRPAIRSTNVVFPEPLPPTIPMEARAGMDNDTPATAGGRSAS